MRAIAPGERGTSPPDGAAYGRPLPWGRGEEPSRADDGPDGRLFLSGWVREAREAEGALRRLRVPDDC